MILCDEKRCLKYHIVAVRAYSLITPPTLCKQPDVWIADATTLEGQRIVTGKPAEAKPRRVMGTKVIGKMLVAKLLAIFLISVTNRGERSGANQFQ